MKLLLRLFVFIFLMSLGNGVKAQLATGDLMFTALNADGNDDWSLVTLKAIPANTVIYFSDNEWDGAAFNTGESHITWNTGAAIIPAGSIIAFTNMSVSGTMAATFGTVAPSAAGQNLGINTSSDAIFVYQGASYTTPSTFLCAIGKGNGDAGAIGATGTFGTTLAGTGLTQGASGTAIYFNTELDIAAYTGVRVGLVQAGYIAELNKMANWATQDGSGDQSIDGTFPDVPFSTAPFGNAPIPLPTISFAPAVQWYNETKDSASIILNLTGTNTGGVTFKLDIEGAWGTATQTVDFGALNKDTAYSSGVTGLLTVKVPIVNDLLNEGDEYAVVKLSNVNGATVTGGNFFTLHIIDNDRMAPVASNALSFSLLSSIRNKTAGTNSAEIVAYEKTTKRLWVVNSVGNAINIYNMANPAAPVLFLDIPIGSIGGINSIAIKDGVIVAAFENTNKLLPGKLVFYDADGNVLKQIDAGVLPDMVGISPDGRYVVSANEAEPADDYLTDPEGSVTIIDISGGIPGLSQANATTVSLAPLNGSKSALRAAGVRIYGRFGGVADGSSVAQDLEPEYVTFSPDSKKAYITLQEANALLVIDLDNKSIALDQNNLPFIKSFGLKDHSLVGNGFDASDQADSINISRWKVKGMYMPDAVATITSSKGTFFISANEGDSRAYAAQNEEAVLSQMKLDPVAFPDSLVLRQAKNLGRLTFSNATGDTDGDGDFDELHLLGSRSFSIWDINGTRVWDSGDDLEQIVKQYTRPFFNANNSTGNPAIKNRSDNKGPEPEGVTVGVVCGNTYAFVCMERSGGVVAYNVTDPLAPKFSAYANNRTSPANASTNDTGAEGIIFISPAESPNGQSLLLLANEISSSVSVFQVNCSPLQPVDLLRFDGRLQAADAVLNWQIASEDDLKYFEIQHSTDGRNYATLGKVQPTGTNYQYVHTNIAEGKHFYRLITLEKDGKQKQSRVVVLVKGQAGSFIVGLLQNPVNSFVTTKLYNNKSQWANAVISDIAGRIIATSKTQLAKGEQQLKMTAPVANGVYFITITTEDGLRETLRFVK